MKTRKIDIIKICIIIITLCLLYIAIRNIYYDSKYSIKNHDARKLFCDSGGLVYIKSLQTSKDIVKCCELGKENGVDHIIYCEDILIK